MAEKKQTRVEAAWGIDFDGWALPLSSAGRPPYWSHFTASRAKPATPKGTVPVKLVPLSVTRGSRVSMGNVPVDKKPRPPEVFDDE